MTIFNDAIGPALTRAETHLFESDSPEAVIARREADQPRPDDEERAVALAAEITQEQDDTGSWGDDLVRTAERMLLLHELVAAGASDAAAAHAAAHGLAWLRTRRNSPGRFADGCDPERHERGICHHFMAGFFAPTGEPDAPVRLGIGIDVDGGEEARLAASCIALRAVNRWSEPGTDARLHLLGLEHLISYWDGWSSELISPPAALAALAAIIDAPPSPSRREAAERGLARIRRRQRADGSWPDADTFQVLDVLLAAIRRYGPDLVDDGTLARAAGLLAATQSAEDGRWGAEAPPARTLIGWRALREAAGRSVSRSPARR